MVLTEQQVASGGGPAGQETSLFPPKKHPQQPFFKSFWLNSTGCFQKLSQQLSKYFIAFLDVVDKVDAVISCNAFYLPEQTEVLMQISIFVSM